MESCGCLMLSCWLMIADVVCSNISVNIGVTIGVYMLAKLGMFIGCFQFLAFPNGDVFIER